VQLPRHIARFFQAYQLPIISVALILAVIVALRVVLAVIDTLNGVPYFKEQILGENPSETMS
jgi:hypothetical protein